MSDHGWTTRVFLPDSVDDDAEQFEVTRLHLLAMRRFASLDPGSAKTDADDTEAASDRTMTLHLCDTRDNAGQVAQLTLTKLSQFQSTTARSNRDRPCLRSLAQAGAATDYSTPNPP